MESSIKRSRAGRPETFTETLRRVLQETEASDEGNSEANRLRANQIGQTGKQKSYPHRATRTSQRDSRLCAFWRPSAFD